MLRRGVYTRADGARRFDTAEVDRFAAALVREVTRRLPAAQVDSSNRKRWSASRA